jgi:hypothetical protein
MIRITHRGNFSKTMRFLNKASHRSYLSILRRYGEEGVLALSNATPTDSGLTAESWSYEITETADGASITWKNSNLNQGINIALLLQYGHGTGTGGYVEGRDYINPALQPIFDKLAEDAWREVTSS